MRVCDCNHCMGMLGGWAHLGSHEAGRRVHPSRGQQQYWHQGGAIHK